MVLLPCADAGKNFQQIAVLKRECNRAAASLGLVRTSTQNGGQTIRVIGARRVVMAFDPENDDPDLLRTVVLLLRTTAVIASARKGVHQIARAEERRRSTRPWGSSLRSTQSRSWPAPIQKSATLPVHPASTWARPSGMCRLSVITRGVHADPPNPPRNLFDHSATKIKDAPAWTKPGLASTTDLGLFD